MVYKLPLVLSISVCGLWASPLWGIQSGASDVGATENKPSFKTLFAEETSNNLEGLERVVLSDLGAASANNTFLQAGSSRRVNQNDLRQASPNADFHATRVNLTDQAPVTAVEWTFKDEPGIDPVKKRSDLLVASKNPDFVDPEAFRVSSPKQQTEDSEIGDSRDSQVEAAPVFQSSETIYDAPPNTTQGSFSGVGGGPLERAFGASEIGDPYGANRVHSPGIGSNAVYQTKTWRTPDMRYRPLYFEDAPLERHGQGLSKLQPALSGVRFLGSVLLLPQKMLATSPKSYVHPVGYGRPGDYQPIVRETLPRRANR